MNFGTIITTLQFPISKSLIKAGFSSKKVFIKIKNKNYFIFFLGKAIFYLYEPCQNLYCQEAQK